MIAKIIIVSKDNQVVDTWEGRWANTNAPQTSGEIWLLNRIDLPANNQRATLDIGYRLEGEKVFTGWDNEHFVGASHRVPIEPGIYRLNITIAAANMEERSFIFNLTIPDEPQSELSYPKIEWSTVNTTP